jgi:tripartite-type tricarboxylate transporter receptor subunit TctC
MPIVKAGRVVLIGVGDATRLTNMPDVPTIAEQGVPGYEAYSWAGVIAPAGLKQDVVNAMSKAIHEAVTDPTFHQLIYDNGMVPLPGTSGDFKAIVQRDTKKWGELIKSAGIGN